MSSDPLWADYTKTVIDVYPSVQEAFRIRPEPPGVSGDWPTELAGPVHILTAWNPGFDRADDKMNHLRQEALEAELRGRDLEIWAAIGRDPDSAHREESTAVIGISEVDALALGAQYRQSAIFSWTPSALVVISCVDSYRHEAGWRTEAL